MTIQQFVIDAFHQNGICVFAAQINGRIELAPIQYCEVEMRTSSISPAHNSRTMIEENGYV